MNEEVEEVWKSGTLNSKVGLFPSNFMKELEITYAGEAHEEGETAYTAVKCPYSEDFPKASTYLIG